MRKHFFLFITLLFHCLVAIAAPYNGQGRIAVSADGNFHNTSDWVATPTTLALIAKQGYQSKLVHYDYSAHLGDSDPLSQQEMQISALQGADYFGFEKSRFYDDISNLAGSVASLKNAINASSVINPLFLIVAGPFEVAFQGIQAADPAKRKFVTVISHSSWNNEHVHGVNAHGADDVKQLGVNFAQINDQSLSLNTQQEYSVWNWMAESGDDALRWIYARMNTAHAADVSDAGMAYWLLTGDQEVNSYKLKNFLLADRSNNEPRHTVPSCTGHDDSNGLVIIEAESTASELGEWELKNLIKDHSGSGYLHFAGNNLNGEYSSSSPIRYPFHVNQSGSYRLYVKANSPSQSGSSESNGFIRIEGNYTESVGSTPLSVLKQDSNLVVSNTNGWGWLSQLDADGNRYAPIYYLKAGETYTIVLSGGSETWNVDRITLRHTTATQADALNSNTAETRCGMSLTAAPRKTAAIEDFKYLYARHSDLCIEAQNASTTNSSNVLQNICSNRSEKKWRLLSSGNGYYQIQAQHSSKCFDVQQFSRLNGANVQQWNCGQGANQQFKLVEKSNGWFQLKAKHSGKCLDIAEVSLDRLANLQQWSCGSGTNQQFKLAD